MTRRVVKDPHDPDNDYWWAVEKGECVPRYKGPDGTQRMTYGDSITPERVALWTDLLANPNEPEADA